MNETTIGANADDFRLPIKSAIRQVADLEFRALELATVDPDVSPTRLSSSGRRHLARFVSGLGLELTSLVADCPGLSLSDPRTVDERVRVTTDILEMAQGMNVSTVTASTGLLIHPDTSEPLPLAMEALKQLGDVADSWGRILAIRPSADSGEDLVRLIRDINCPAICIGLDPAARVMQGANPLELIQQFPDQIAVMHVRDGTVGNRKQIGRETRLGEGEVDLVGMLEWLRAVEYRGPYVIRRTDSQTPAADIQKARVVLAQLLQETS